MKKLRAILGVIGFVAAIVLPLVLMRIREARGYGMAHHVRTPGGTNYVASVQETTAGRTDAGKVVIVTVRLENPNAFEMTLSRNWFVLVDQNKDYYLPGLSGATNEWIHLPARGSDAAELLTYAVDDDALNGSLGLQVGYQYWVLVKSTTPYKQALNKDEFRSFRRRDW